MAFRNKSISLSSDCQTVRTDHRIHGGLRKCLARNFARNRRDFRGFGLGRGAIGGAKYIDPRSSLSGSPSDALPDREKNCDVASEWLELSLSSLSFLIGSATAINRDTRLGIILVVMPQTKRDAVFATLGTKLAICWISRPGSDCKKREPVSVRGDRAPALRGLWPRHPCAALHIRAQARSRAAHPRHGV